MNIVSRIFVFALMLWITTGCEWLYDAQDFSSEPAPIFRAATLTDPGTPSQPAQLRVVAWNIKYGAARIPFWFDCWGDKVQMSRQEVEANLDKLAALIDEMDPDILMLEEIEVNSKRSAYIDMLQVLLDKTSMNYGAYFESWDSRWVAADGLGRMNLGNAILSRYPITDALRIKQAERSDQDPLTSAFYIKRVIGRAEVELRGLTAAPTERKVAAFVVHTEAYDNDGTKQKQIQQIYDEVTKETLPYVLGGDFNELPPTAARKQDFPDERQSAVCSEDFAQPPYTPEVMQPFFDDLQPWISLSRYGTSEAAQARWFTHSVLGPDETNEAGEPGRWNRTLDYLFASKGKWVYESGDVLQRAAQPVAQRDGSTAPLVGDPQRLSDHAPVFGIWEVQ
ncbi:MAG TPA: hypothetical protein DCQ06_13295 [Myxococcales bacterium]|nr:hypothetical protein [Myxococcales bacterium]HAN32565.1 hypothetical protein [Myxococcales bacterium]